MRKYGFLTCMAFVIVVSFFFGVDSAVLASSTDLLNTISALKGHIDGTGPLTGTGIATHQQVIANNKTFMDESSAVVNACLDLIDTFDNSSLGPLFISPKPSTYDRNADNSQSFDWTMYKFMQYVFDEIYTQDNLAVYETELDGFVYKSSDKFPGVIKPGATVVSHSATIKASYPDTLGWLRQQDDLPARKPTGTYLVPGTIATVTVPASIVNKGFQVRVGAHSWDLESRNRRWVKRFDRCTKAFDINSTIVKVTNPLGGGIYIEVPYLANEGVVTVDIDNVIRSPFFSSNTVTGHITTLNEWQNTERNFKAPWADFQTEKYMTQVPTSWIYAMDDPVTAMAEWDAGIDAMNDLMGFPRDRGKETTYTQVDVILRSSVHAPGYPAVNQTDGDPSADRGGNKINYLVYGPNYPFGAASTEIHEQGHAYFFDKFAGEQESAVNLPYAAMLNRVFGHSFDRALAASRGMQGNSHITLNNAAIVWMTSFNFSPRNTEMHQLEKQYQPKGHAKFVDIAKLFGWEVINNYYHQLVLENKNKNNSGLNDDDRILRMSREAGVDLRPLFHFWGVHPIDPTALAAAINAENLAPSGEIYSRLMEYKSIVPVDNAAFQTFGRGWWNKDEPNINGYWTETEHARQWDTRMRRQKDIDNQQRTDITEGEMYIEACAAQVRDRVQEIIDMYFPDGPPHFFGELGNDIVTWSGRPVVVNAAIENNTTSTLNSTWNIDPNSDVTLSTTNDQATVTITKPSGDPATYQLSLTLDDGAVHPSVTDVVTIWVYDDACQATLIGLKQADKMDLDPDCIININDLAIMLKTWLNDNSLQSPVEKPAQ